MQMLRVSLVLIRDYILIFNWSKLAWKCDLYIQNICGEGLEL